MVNNCVVQGCVVGTAKQNVTLHEFPKSSPYRRLEATGLPTRHSHVCSPHFVSLDFVNDVEYYWLRKERVINKTAVPTMFPSKCAISQRSLSQPLDAEGRLGLAAGPDSERRTPVNKSS